MNSIEWIVADYISPKWPRQYYLSRMFFHNLGTHTLHPEVECMPPPIKLGWSIGFIQVE